MTAMAKLEKFLFDTEFEVDDPDWDKEEVEEAPDPDTVPRYSENEMRAALQQANDESRAAGHTAGLAEARDEIASFAAQELVRITHQIDRLADAEAKNDNIARSEAADLALAIGRRLAGALIDRHPVAFAEQMIVDTLSHLTEALRDSKIVIRVSPDLVAQIDEHIASITAKVAFTGQTIVIGEDGFTMGDCRVEWAYGGAERLMSDIDNWVGDAVTRYLAAIAAPPEREPEAPVEASLVEAPPEETSDTDDELAEDGVKSVGGSKAVRYDTPVDETPDDGAQEESGSIELTPDGDADDVKTVGGSKTVRYE
ncbi:MAG: hypothetical protein HQ495_07890 [Alphaproteobacteria bacterium]|nr:hypothetical protein [Alphaproteobacteria bacterium]